MSKKSSNIILKLAMDSAEIMLSNGAETNRVEETMRYILKPFAHSSVESFVTTTGIICTIENEDNEILTMVRRVKNRTVNLEKVSLVNDLSRRLERKMITLDEAIIEIETIRNKPSYSTKTKILVSGLCCAAFSVLFGGISSDVISAFISGFFLAACLTIFGKAGISNFMINILGGCIVAASAFTLVYFDIGKNMDNIIVSSIMILVPGVGLTNAVRDVLAGDYLSGISRILDAILVAVSIAIGVGVIFRLVFHIS